MAASFDSYKVFYFVAKYCNITRAASALFLAQSTVTRSIQSLESELGCKLFLRNFHGVTLTKEGEVLFRHISVGCDAFFDGEARLQKLITAKNNELRIGVNDFIYQQYLIPALMEFSKICPDVCVTVSTQRHSDTEEIYSFLKDGLLDILFVFAPTPEDSDLKVQTSGKIEDILIAGNAFSSFRDRQVSFADLKHCPFVVRSAADGSTSFLEKEFERYGITIHPRYHVDTITHYVPMVRAGLCLAMLPEPVFEKEENAEGLFKLQLSVPLPSRTICIATSKTKPLSLPGEELIRCFRQQIIC